MATRIVEWKKGGEWEIMRWVYNYNSHNVYRYFRQYNGIVSKDLVL